MKLSKISFPKGVHIAGQTRYQLDTSLFAIDATHEGVIIRDQAGIVYWVPSAHADVGVVAPEALAKPKPEAK